MTASFSSNSGSEDGVAVDRPFSAKIETLSGFGLSPAEIATVLGHEEALVRKAYAAELAGGEIKANARVAESLFRKATGEGHQSVTAAIFWLKTRAKWSEASGRSLTAVSEPMTFNVVYEAPPDRTGASSKSRCELDAPSDT